MKNRTGTGQGGGAGLVVLGLAMLSGLAGCNQRHETPDERLQRQTAESTRQLRQDAQMAGVEARKAVRQAGREAKDIVAGVRQGWRDGAPPDAHKPSDAEPADLNTASISQLTALPGISAVEARRIERHRPYTAPSDLVKRRLLTQAEYDRVADRVTVHSGP